LLLVGLIRLVHLEGIGHVFFQIVDDIHVHCLFCFLRIDNQFAYEITTLLDYFQVHTVEVNIHQLVSSNELILDDFVVVTFKANELTIFIQSEEKHFKAIINSEGKPSSYQTHQNIEKYEVYAFLSY